MFKVKSVIIYILLESASFNKTNFADDDDEGMDGGFGGDSNEDESGSSDKCEDDEDCSEMDTNPNYCYSYDKICCKVQTPVSHQHILML